jgi:hypothetical protein
VGIAVGARGEVPGRKRAVTRENSIMMMMIIII